MEVLLDHISELNWLAVLVATVAAMVIGSVWYMPAVFGNAWMKSIGIKQKDFMDGSMQPMLIAVVSSFVTAVALGVLVQVLELTTVWQGATFGIFVALALLATNKVMQAQFEKRPLSYNVITSSADVVTLGVLSAILAVWR